MKKISFQSFSQYAHTVEQSFRRAACGPTTIYSILFHYGGNVPSINTIFKKARCRSYGLSKRKMIRYLKQYGDPSYCAESGTIDEALREIDAGRPVAMKFDKWFSGRWWERPTYDYHWVPLIGYVEKEDELQLIVGTNRAIGETRTISYQANRPVLSFVLYRPHSERD